MSKKPLSVILIAYEDGQVEEIHNSAKIEVKKEGLSFLDPSTGMQRVETWDIIRHFDIKHTVSQEQKDQAEIYQKVYSDRAPKKAYNRTS